MNWIDEWLSVLFSVEKNFNLDCPDGWAYFWHDIRKEPQTLFNRQQGRDSLMVWRTFSYNRTINIVFLKGGQCSEDYQQILKPQLFLFGKLLGGDEWIYQQNNCSIHVSNSTMQCNAMQWFRQNQVTVMDWPALI